MNDHVDMFPLVVVIVAFIAGYSVISFIVTKIQEANEKRKRELQKYFHPQETKKKEDPK